MVDVYGQANAFMASMLAVAAQARVDMIAAFQQTRATNLEAMQALMPGASAQG